MGELLPWQYGVLTVVILALRLVCVGLYRLYFCPTAKFPGPLMAKLTFWYEGYWDIWRNGRYSWKIQELHEQYGPIVRINPEELHVEDPEFYEQLYVGAGRRTNKWHWSAKMFGTTQASVGTVDHDSHRVRRMALNPFFSKAAVLKLEPVIQANVDRLVDRLQAFAGSGLPVNLNDAFTALAADVIGSYAFGKSFNFLDSDGFAPGWRKFLMELSRGTHLMKQLRWAYKVLICIPEPIVAIVHPLSRDLFKLRRVISEYVRAAAGPRIRNNKTEGNSMPQKSIFNGLFETNTLPSEELSELRLTEEGLTIIGAGTVTTAHTLAIIFFYVLSSAEVSARLRHELYAPTSWTQPLPYEWSKLSQLPYLSAVISEGLRLSYGVSHRLQRIAPDTDLMYGDYRIPRGTPVSMTNMFIHNDSTLFPRPKEFLPQRWLNKDVEFPPLKEAKRFLLPFSRGTRACLGVNLAYAELYLTVGACFQPLDQGGLDLALYKTTFSDVECLHDFFNPSARIGSEGVRVLVKQRLG